MRSGGQAIDGRSLGSGGLSETEMMHGGEIIFAA